MAVKVLATGLYTSAVFVEVTKLKNPPVTRTWPLGSRVAVWLMRAEVILEVMAVKVLATGLYTSAVLRELVPPLISVDPPVRRTRPLGSRVAVWPKRAVIIVAVSVVKVLAMGSYSSAVLATVREELAPPVTRTWPLGSREGVWPARDEGIVALRAV